MPRIETFCNNSGQTVRAYLTGQGYVVYCSDHTDSDFDAQVDLELPVSEMYGGRATMPRHGACSQCGAIVRADAPCSVCGA